MAIDFPNSPANNAYFESNGKAWTFNGTSWDIAQTPANLSIADASITGAKLASGAAVTNIGYTPANIASPTFTGTVAGITKSMVGLGSVDNTADTAKPVSTAQQTALDLKSPLAGPTFTGTVVLPSTTSIGTVSSTEIGYVDGVTSAIQTQLDSKLTATTAVTSGRNMVVNGDFKIWQRGTSFSSPANATFTADRWFMYYDGSGATRTISQQTFTGDNPTGLNVSNYMRVAITVAGTGSTTNGMFYRTEDVRKLNGQTVTLSFYGKADTTRNMNWQTYQEFGTGGSSAVLANSQGFTFTSSWQRFSVSFTMPSVSGKTITANSSISFIVTFPQNATGTFDITGVQLEAGAVATPFEFEDIGTTLAKCQRYYWRSTTGLATDFNSRHAHFRRLNAYQMIATGYCAFPVTMRAEPTVALYNGSGIGYVDAYGGGQESYVIASGEGLSVYGIGILVKYTNSGLSTTASFNADPASYSYWANIEASAEL
jgi:hypothetical protein